MTKGYIPVPLYSNAKEEDDILRFFDMCPIYINSVADNKTTSEQSYLFHQNNFQSVIDRVNAKLSKKKIFFHFFYFYFYFLFLYFILIFIFYFFFFLILFYFLRHD